MAVSLCLIVVSEHLDSWLSKCANIHCLCRSGDWLTWWLSISSRRFDLYVVVGSSALTSVVAKACHCHSPFLLLSGRMFAFSTVARSRHSKYIINCTHRTQYPALKSASFYPSALKFWCATWAAPTFRVLLLDSCAWWTLPALTPWIWIVLWLHNEQDPCIPPYLLP